MNSQLAANAALDSLLSIALALQSIAKAGLPPTGPDGVEVERQNFEKHMEAAKVHATAYFDELAGQTAHASPAPVPSNPAIAHAPLKTHTNFLGQTVVDEPLPVRVE